MLVRSETFCCAVAMAALAGPAPARAGLIFFTNEAAFDAAAGALSTQTFASANVTAGNADVIANPLNSATNNAVFTTDSILAGLSISSSAEHAGQDLAVAGVGAFGNANKAVFNNFGGDTFELTFASGVSAVGFSYYNLISSDVDVTVTAPGGASLGSQATTTNPTGGPSFFGIVATSGSLIGQVGLRGESGIAVDFDFAGVDRIVFAGATSVPAPEPTGLVLLSSGVAAVALRFLRRRRAA
jgi:hypothetical protein